MAQLIPEEKFHYHKRWAKVQSLMKENSLMVLTSPPPKVRNQDTYYPYRSKSDLLYLTGINEQNLAIILKSDGDVLVFCQEKDLEKERWEGPVLGPEKVADKLGLELSKIKSFVEFRQNLLRELRGKSVLYYDFGFDPEFDNWLLQEIHQSRLRSRQGDALPEEIIHSGAILHEIRLIKDELDLFYLKKAIAISAKAHNRLMRFTRKFSGGISEFEMKAFIEREFKRLGADYLAYPSIVAAANHATILHYEKNFGFARPQDLVLVDAGAEYQSYASDITRTFPAGGKFSALQKELYLLVLEAQKAAISHARVGCSLEEVHEAAVRILCDGLWQFGLLRKIPEKNGSQVIWHFPASLSEVLEKKLYKAFYMHRTSHYLGLDVHDVGKYYVQGKSRPLEEGMVITVEPGLYFPEEYDFIPKEFLGIGIRIEDDVLIKKEGNEVLSSECVKEWHEIESLEAL